MPTVQDPLVYRVACSCEKEAARLRHLIPVEASTTVKRNVSAYSHRLPPSMGDQS